MAKKCLHCEKKIGFFQKAVEKVYCSEQCAEAAAAQMAEQQKQADALRDQAKIRAAADEERDRAEQAEAAAHDLLLHTCPKCEKPWQYTAPSGEDGVHAGSCPACHLEIEFLRIDRCGHCRATAMLITPDHAGRCVRCRTSLRASIPPSYAR
jgi:hypothetical protein